MKQEFQVLLEKDPNGETTAITIPFDVNEVFGTRARVPVRGTINGAPFRSSIFPQAGKSHYMVVNRTLRESARIQGGEEITVVLERDDEPRTVTTPEDLLTALSTNAAAQTRWEKLSYTHQKEYVQAIEEAKRPETRTRRIAKTLEALEKG
jgi:hypothetical protein